MNLNPHLSIFLAGALTAGLFGFLFFRQAWAWLEVAGID